MLTLTSLHPLTFLKTDSFGPSRWDRQDYGHMPAAIRICGLGQWQFSQRNVASLNPRGESPPPAASLIGDLRTRGSWRGGGARTVGLRAGIQRPRINLVGCCLINIREWLGNSSPLTAPPVVNDYPRRRFHRNLIQLLHDTFPYTTRFHRRCP